MAVRLNGFFTNDINKMRQIGCHSFLRSVCSIHPSRNIFKLYAKDDELGIIISKVVGIVP